MNKRVRQCHTYDASIGPLLDMDIPTGGRGPAFYDYAMRKKVRDEILRPRKQEYDAAKFGLMPNEKKGMCREITEKLLSSGTRFLRCKRCAECLELIPLSQLTRYEAVETIQQMFQSLSKIKTSGTSSPVLTSDNVPPMDQLLPKEMRTKSSSFEVDDDDDESSRGSSSSRTSRRSKKKQRTVTPGFEQDSCKKEARASPAAPIHIPQDNSHHLNPRVFDLSSNRPVIVQLLCVCCGCTQTSQLKFDSIPKVLFQQQQQMHQNPYQNAQEPTGMTTTATQHGFPLFSFPNATTMHPHDHPSAANNGTNTQGMCHPLATGHDTKCHNYNHQRNISNDINNLVSPSPLSHLQASLQQQHAAEASREKLNNMPLQQPHPFKIGEAGIFPTEQDHWLSSFDDGVTLMPEEEIKV